MELAIDSATGLASLAVARQGRVLAEVTWPSAQGHTSQLLPQLQHLLRLAGAGPRAGAETAPLPGLLRLAGAGLGELTAVAVVVGPGSFNGLRAGIITAKGLAFSLGIPLVGVNTLDAEAYPFSFSGRPVCAVVMVGRDMVGATIQRDPSGLRRVREEEVVTAAQLQRLPSGVMLCGEVSAEAADCLKDRLFHSQRRAGHVAALGWERLGRGEKDDPDTLEARYVTHPQTLQPSSNKEGT